MVIPNGLIAKNLPLILPRARLRQELGLSTMLA